jgi:glycerol kinase
LPFILALDQGTTSSRALLFDHQGTVRSVAQREFKQIFPQPGWVEHDPEEIAESQIAVALEALVQAKTQPSDVAAIGITNQRETTIVWAAAPASPSTTPLSGKIAGPLLFVRSSKPKATKP